MNRLILALLASLIVSNPLFANTLIDDTAILALKAARNSETGTTYEHGGMIFERVTPEGKIVLYKEPYPHGGPTGVQVIDYKQLFKNDTLVATYHIHLCLDGYYHNLFSKTDIIMVYLSGHPNYMLDECTGEVHVYDPKIDNVSDTAEDANLFGDQCEKVEGILPRGRIIGNTNTMDPIQIAPEIKCVPKPIDPKKQKP